MHFSYPHLYFPRLVCTHVQEGKDWSWSGNNKVHYNRTLLRVKTFTNFTVFEPLTKVFSTKLGMLYPPNMIGFSIPQKFSPTKVSGYVVISETIHTKYRDAFKSLQWVHHLDKAWIDTFITNLQSATVLHYLTNDTTWFHYGVTTIHMHNDGKF